jgi:hypothetical protein
MTSVYSSWRLIEEVLRENANSVFRALRKPVSSAQLRLLESSLPAKLPPDFIQSLKIHVLIDLAVSAGRRDSVSRLSPLGLTSQEMEFRPRDMALLLGAVWDPEVGGSNPLAPIFRISNLRASRDAHFAFAVTFAATLGLEVHRVLLVNFQTRLPISMVARCHEILSISRRSLQ